MRSTRESQHVRRCSGYTVSFSRSSRCVHHDFTQESYLYIPRLIADQNSPSSASPIVESPNTWLAFVHPTTPPTRKGLLALDTRTSEFSTNCIHADQHLSQACRPTFVYPHAHRQDAINTRYCLRTSRNWHADSFRIQCRNPCVRSG